MTEPPPDELTREIALGLPSPDDDQSRSLREQIIAELTDHLLCAGHREQLLDPTYTGTDADQARVWHRVITRFGDPQAVARQLWWDAQWGKTMSQRLTNTLIAAMLLLSAAVALLAWQSIALSRHALNQAQVAAEQFQKSNEAVMQQLAALAGREPPATSPGSSQPSEWNRLEVLLRFDSADGPPVEGAKLQLAGASPNTQSLPHVNLTSGADGKVDFGKMLYGEYYLEVLLPNGASTLRTLGVRPGEDKRETIVCPSQATVPLSIDLIEPSLPPELQLPPELKPRIWYAVAASRPSRPRIPARGNEAEVPHIGAWFGPSQPHLGSLVMFRRPDGSWVPETMAADWLTISDARNILRDEDHRFLPAATRRSSPVEAVHLLPIRDDAGDLPQPALQVPIGPIQRLHVYLYLEVEGRDGKKFLVSIQDQVPESGHYLSRGQRQSTVSQFYSAALASAQTAMPDDLTQRLFIDSAGANHWRISVPREVIIALSQYARCQPGETLVAIVARYTADQPPPDRVDFYWRVSERSRSGTFPTGGEPSRRVVEDIVILENQPVLVFLSYEQDPNRPEFAPLSGLAGDYRFLCAVPEELLSQSLGSSSPARQLYARPAGTRQERE